MCTGNICRSPFIERLLQRRLDDALPGSDRPVLVDSAGTNALTGWDMDEQAAAQLVAHGGNPEGFRARHLTAELIAGSDLVLTATREHRGLVAAMYPKALRQVFAFRDFADLVTGFDGRVTDTHAADVGGGFVAGVDGLTSKVDGLSSGVGRFVWGVDGPGSGVGELSTGLHHTDAQAWVRQVAEKAAASRGLKPPLEPARADIVDPFRRKDEVFATMAQQVVESMSAVVRALVG